jgi:hypothetical protein
VAVWRGEGQNPADPDHNHDYLPARATRYERGCPVTG